MKLDRYPISCILLFSKSELQTERRDPKLIREINTSGRETMQTMHHV